MGGRSIPGPIPPSSMRSRPGALWSWGLGVTLALSLGACAVESLEEQVRPPADGVSQESDGALTRERPEASLTWDPYADAVVSSTTAAVLNASAALGAPDGQATTMLSVLNSALVLDLGQGEEGTGDLRVYYQGLTLALVAQVDFLKADGTFIGSSTLHLKELGLGTHIAVATYPGNVPYRYVRLRGAVLALYLVDVVETSLRPFCGDGVLGGFEVCDDGNQLSGDGCNSVCEVEPGYTCTGHPSVCTDIDECADGTASCQPGEFCVNTPGSYTCEPDLCVGVVCTPLDACHVAGTCHPLTGQCSNPAAPNGTECSDGNACTQPDTCQEGVCTGGPRVGDTTGNLAHRWAFDEASGGTALDSAGTSNGTLGSSASRTVSFDGSGAITLTPTQQCDLNAHVDFGLAPGQFGTDAFTVSYWLKTTFNDASTGDLIGNRVDGSAGNFLSARLNGNSGTSLEIYQDESGTNGAGTGASPTSLNDGSWHHVAYTRSGTSLKMYIDGVLVGAGTSAAPANLTGANSFRIGRRLPDCMGGFSSIPASFDDVRTYSRELTACDVALLNTP
ncbi:EGF domain-containing protein [Corallococcus coralloides DSM 2259]|uniref:EGF domain-containing protein n=1 Tax=Corallococcus coralloides (strain ATCC 25202 / DSM 2259 / NBRC 100086 / M2) TaxID=1144275 RepID=H8MYN7_CORCM|nr:EGF domain-containing protein [Corallococcus coralloides DSM 2259]